MKIHRKTLLLLAIYGVAAVWPEPGLWLRDLPLAGESVRPARVLLAVLLFCAGLSAGREVLPRSPSAYAGVAGSVVLTWLIPAAVALLLVAGGGAAGLVTRQVAVGLLFVAAMPVANSSAPWSAIAGGRVSMSVAVLLLATAAAPLASPAVLSAGSWVLPAGGESLPPSVGSGSLSGFVAAWILTPVLLGVSLSRTVLTRMRVPEGRIRQCGFAVVLVLNYLNAAVCLPAALDEPSMAGQALFAAAVMFVAALGVTRLLVILSGCEPAVATSVELAVSMRNTGAGLVYAGAALASEPAAGVTVLLYTLVQQVGASLLSVRTRGVRAGAEKRAGDFPVRASV